MFFGCTIFKIMCISSVFAVTILAFKLSIDDSLRISSIVFSSFGIKINILWCLVLEIIQLIMQFVFYFNTCRSVDIKWTFKPFQGCNVSKEDLAYNYMNYKSKRPWSYRWSENHKDIECWKKTESTMLPSTIEWFSLLSMYNFYLE